MKIYGMKIGKTFIGGVLAIACGMYLVVSGKNIEYGMGLSTMGFTAIGVGDKLDKMR